MFNSLVHLKYSQCARNIVKYNIDVYYYAYIIHKIGWDKISIDLIGLYNNQHTLREFRRFDARGSLGFSHCAAWIVSHQKQKLYH